jgi:peptidoglycan hydrolase-like protein with peptidoglycan-binding domain
MSARAPGTVTRLPTLGATVSEGQTIYELDGHAVPLLYGDRPAWRDFAAGMSDGPDVKELEQALRDLGYDRGHAMTIDEHFDDVTTAIVKRWQSALGVDQTGTVKLGAAVFWPGPVRVAAHKAEAGSSVGPGAPVLDVTSTTRVVTVKLAATKQSVAKAGDTVVVELPDGRKVNGKIASVGTVATAPSNDNNGGSSTIEVGIALDDPGATGTIDQAPVTVNFTKDRRDNVLVVPVNALLAQADGSYAVEVVGDGAVGARRLVTVQTGLFANSQVEVSGPGIREGMTVVVPS